MKSNELTAAESIVMKSIWEAGVEMSLSEVMAYILEHYGKEWKSQTVSTFLSKLVQKGFIRMKREGRRITYEILVPEEEYKTSQSDKFVSFWNGGSVGEFLTAFYRDKKITKKEIEELRRVIDELDE